MGIPFRTPVRLASGFAILVGSVFAQDPQPGSDNETRIRTLQERYEARITALEAEVRNLHASGDSARSASELEAAVDQQSTHLSSGIMGRLDQTTRFDNRFNPAFGVVGDFVAVASGQRDNFATGNRYFHRGAELNVVGRVDPSVWYAAIIHAKVDEVEFEEGYAVLDGGLPDTFTLKVGKFYYDFGKLLPIHDQELPFVDKPAVAQDYLGGGPIGVGIEVNHWFGLGEVPVRWSVGMVNSPDGDADPAIGPLTTATDLHPSTSSPFGSRSLSSFGYHARVTSRFDVAENHELQIGFSGIWAPRLETFNPSANAPATTDRMHFDKIDLGADFTWHWQDPSRNDWFVLGTEILFNSERFVDGVGASRKEDALGGYAYAEYGIDAHWSVGTFVDLLQRREDPDRLWRSVGAYLTWNIDHFDRLRLLVEAVDDQLQHDSYGALTLQWTVVIGAHAHPLDW